MPRLSPMVLAAAAAQRGAQARRFGRRRIHQLTDSDHPKLRRWLREALPLQRHKMREWSALLQRGHRRARTCAKGTEDEDGSDVADAFTMLAALLLLDSVVLPNVGVHPLAEAGEARCSESGATKG